MTLLPKGKILTLLFVVFSSQGNAQEKISELSWDSITHGIALATFDLPEKSIVGDSKLTIVRIDPRFFEASLYTASSNNNIKTNPQELADSLQFQILFNAGMYDLRSGLRHRGYLKNKEHHNNPNRNDRYNAVIALDPTDSSESTIQILDLTCTPWDSLVDNFQSIAQVPRMISCQSSPLSWNKRKQSCSMLVLGSDAAGLLYLFFTRSPYTHNQMIQFILELPLTMATTVYLEGGPETSLYICTEEREYHFIGSFVSETYERDDNNQFWKLPNWIGLRQKIQH